MLFTELNCMLKVVQDNIRILHRNVSGHNFYGAHDILEEYYKKVDDIADNMIEFAIALGEHEPNLVEAVEHYSNLNLVGPISQDKAFMYCKKYFKDIYDAMEEIKERVPAAVVSEMEGFQQWLFIEGEFKITHRLVAAE